MKDEGYYWVKVAHFMSWQIAYTDGVGRWKIIDDENEYHNIDFNSIHSNKILNPDELIERHNL